MKNIKRFASATAVGVVMFAAPAAPAFAAESGDVDTRSTDTTTEVSPDTNVSPNVDLGSILSGNETGVANGDNLNGIANGNETGSDNSADGNSVDAGNGNLVSGVLDSVL